MTAAKPKASRVHLSSKSLARMRRVQWASLAVAGLVIAFGGAYAPLGYFSAGVSVVLFLGAFRARTETSHCSFCDQPREKVKAIVTAPTVCICDECAALAVGAASEQDPAGWTLVAGALPPHCPWSLSHAVVDALITRDPSPASLRHAVGEAFRLQNMAAAEHAGTRIAESERTATDWLMLGVAMGKQGRHADAIVATARVTDEPHLPWVKNNLAWFSARNAAGSYRDPGKVTRETADRWLADLDDARRMVADRKPEGWATLHSRCLGTRAEILRVVGELDGALVSLDRLAADGPLDGEQRLCRARVLAQMKRESAAITDLKVALTTLHPESEDTKEARALLEQLAGKS